MIQFNLKRIKEGVILKQTIERFQPPIDFGLTEEQVSQRMEENLQNYDTSVPTKSIKRILYENFFTLFNFLNLALAIAVFWTGSYKNMLFIFIIILNTTISTWQEIHSKRIVDKLAIMASSKAKITRNGKKQEISLHEIVLDDIIEFHPGDQIPTDCILLTEEIEVNESFLTGEPNSILKTKEELLLSGSFVVSGKATAQVEHIGDENYTAQISSGAKYVKKVNSEIMNSLNTIIKFLTFAIIPIGFFLFWNQLQIDGNSLQNAILKTVAAIIGMIPEGLVLLTSTVLAVSVIRLSRSKVLVQELYCIETLARVDTLCLDKTGTLTEGKMEVKDSLPIGIEKEELENILANIAKFSQDTNSTIEAIQEKNYPFINEFTLKQIIPFSSQKKWSGICFEETGSYILGAPERVLKETYEQYQEKLETYIQDYRVLVLAHSKNHFQDKELPSGLQLIGIILITDKIRKEAFQTLQYFKEQGVSTKIISGDNAITVSQIAKQVGLEHYEQYIDMSTIKTLEELEKVAQENTIFGRVSPTQKKDLVLALQKQGKTVAMTGDGVNDVLALKAADCSIAMANGSDATKNVAQLILLDSNFASMPKIVSEGRRTINNIQRSASLFLVKTIYSSILALLFIFLATSYPFEPIQLSLISVLTIGIPSFLLALEPNKERIHGNFLKNILTNAIPTALTVILNIVILSLLRKTNQISGNEFSTLAVFANGFCGILLLFTLSKARKSEHKKLPISLFRFLLACILFILFIIGLTQLNWLFNFVQIQAVGTLILKITIVSVLNFTVLTCLIKKLLNKH